MRVPEHVVLSFHGVPRRTLALGDPYHCYCQKTARLLARELDSNRSSGRSRSSRGSGADGGSNRTRRTCWRRSDGRSCGASTCSRPGSSPTASRRSRSSPSRPSARSRRAGGGDYNVIPCLNEHPRWIAALADLVVANLQGWLQPPPGPAEREATLLRAKALGAAKLTLACRRLRRRALPVRAGGFGARIANRPCLRDIAARDVETAGCGPICATIRYDPAPPTTMTASEPRPDTSASTNRCPRTAILAQRPLPRRRTIRCRRRRAEAAEMKDAWLRARAEIENVRRQGQADVARAHKYADREVCRGPARRQGCARADGLRRRVGVDRHAESRRRSHAEIAGRGVREGADPRDRPGRPEIRSAPASGDAGGRQRPSRPTPSSRCSRRAT